MCDPLVGAGLFAASSLVSGIQQKQQADAAADVAEMNADIARQQGSSEAARARAKINKVLGSQRAAQASSGLAMTGSALDVGEDSAREGALDVATIIYGGAVRGNAYETEADNLRFQGNQALIGGVLGAGTSFLGEVFAPVKAVTPGTTRLAGPRTLAWHQAAGI